MTVNVKYAFMYVHIRMEGKKDFYVVWSTAFIMNYEGKLSQKKSTYQCHLTNREKFTVDIFRMSIVSIFLLLY